MRRTSFVPLLLLGVLTAACGTTVPNAGLAAQGTGAAMSAPGDGTGTDAGLGAPVVSGQPEALGTVAGPGSATSSGVSGVPAGGSQTSPQQPVDSAVDAGGPLPRGVTPTTVTIAVMASKTLGEAFAAFGGTGPPDPTPQIEALAGYVNSHGGLKGKKLQVHFTWRDDTNSAQDFSSQDQAMCSDMTQDNKVFLALSAYQAHGLVPCLSKAGVPLIESGAGPPHLGVSAWDRAGGLYQTPNQMSACRYTRSLVDGLYRQGYFKGAQKIGLPYMAYDYMKAAVGRCLLPAMKELGLPAPDVVEYAPLHKATDYSQTQTEAANSVLRYKAAGVTHVIFLEDQSTTFIDAAKSQRYRPRYGYGSLSVPAGMADLEKEEMTGSTGVGISPAVDVVPRDGDPPVSSGETLCRQIMVKAGLQTQVSDPVTWGIMRFHCEGFFYLQRVVDRAPALTVAGIVNGAAALRRDYTPLTTWGFETGPGRYDGVAAARPLVYVESCTCTRYSGPPYAVP